MPGGLCVSREALVNEPSEEELWGELDVASGPRRGEILLELADRCFQRHDMSQFGTLVDAAAEASVSAGDDRLAAYARFNQGQGLMETSEYAAAAECFLQAAAYFHLIGADADVAMSHQRAGDAYCHAGDGSAALEQWHTALRLFEADDDPVQVGRTWMLIGGEQINREQHAEAEESFFSARTAFRRAGSASHVAWADDSAAESLIRQGRVEDAAPLLRSCLDIVSVGTDSQAIGYAGLRLGMAMRLLGSTDESLTLLREARMAFREADDFGGVARCDLEAGQALRAVGEDVEAESLLQSARSLLDGVGADSFLLVADHARAELLLDAGRALEAEAAARECLRTAVETGDHEMVAAASLLAARALLEQGQAAAALTMVEAHLGHPSSDDERFSPGQLLVWARVLFTNDAHDDARGVLESLMRNAALTNDAALHAEVRELRWRVRRAVRAVETDESEGHAHDPDGDLARAVALLLAVGAHDRAIELSQHLLSEGEGTMPPVAANPPTVAGAAAATTVPSSWSPGVDLSS